MKHIYNKPQFTSQKYSKNWSSCSKSFLFLGAKFLELTVLPIPATREVVFRDKLQQSLPWAQVVIAKELAHRQVVFAAAHDVFIIEKRSDINVIEQLLVEQRVAVTILPTTHRVVEEGEKVILKVLTTNVKCVLDWHGGVATIIRQGDDHVGQYIEVFKFPFG